MEQEKNKEFDGILNKATSLNKKRSGGRPRAPRQPKRPVVELKTETLQLISDSLNNRTALTHKKLELASPAAIYQAFGNFEEAVGGRQKLLETLAYCPETSMGYVLMQKLTADPALLKQVEGEEEKESATLHAICARNRIPLNMVVAAFRDSRISQITIEALTAVSDRTPEVVEQLADSATSRWTECTNCRGKRRVKRIADNGEFAVDEHGDYVTQLCWICRGEGVVWAAHDWQNRNKFLEIVGVSKKEPLINNTIDNRSVNIGGSGGTGLEATMKALDNLLRGKKEPTAIEVEVIDVQPEGH